MIPCLVEFEHMYKISGFFRKRVWIFIVFGRLGKSKYNLSWGIQGSYTIYIGHLGIIIPYPLHILLIFYNILLVILNYSIRITLIFSELNEYHKRCHWKKLYFHLPICPKVIDPTYAMPVPLWRLALWRHSINRVFFHCRFTHCFVHTCTQAKLVLDGHMVFSNCTHRMYTRCFDDISSFLHSTTGILVSHLSMHMF